jgi:hypothetical protein
MNEGTGGRRTLPRIRPPRTGLLVFLAGVAVVTAACSAASANSPVSASSETSFVSSAPSASGGSASSGTSAPSGGSSAYQQGVAYAQCMRAHDVPNFPDPLPNGGFELSPEVTGGTGGQVSPTYEAAEQACASLNPTGTLTFQKAEQDLNRLLKFAACMRSHGEPKFPDPVYNSTGVTLHIVGLDRNSPQFQDAWRTCMSLVPLASGAEGGS